MKCQPVNNIARLLLACGALFASLSASAAIENTVFATYDLATGKNIHHTMLFADANKQSTFTLIPFGDDSIAPSIFKVMACVNHHAGRYTQGELRFNTIQTDKRDIHATNIGIFLNEHKLSTWWTPLEDHLTLIQSIDPSGIIIINTPAAFITNAPQCPPR